MNPEHRYFYFFFLFFHVATVYSQLTAHIFDGRNLPGSDGFGGLPDLYVEVIAVDCQGMVHMMRTEAVDDTRNPVWNEHLDFGLNFWSSVQLRLIDEDLIFDDLIGQTPVLRGTLVKRNSTFCADDNTTCSGTDCDDTCTAAVYFSLGHTVTSGM